MNYTTKQVADKLGVTKDTLFYYEKEGLLPTIKRDELHRRLYTQSDIDWIYLICCLRETDMPICTIKEYVAQLKSDSINALTERRTILTAHQHFIDDKIKTYQTLRTLINKKIEFYDETLLSENPEAIKCMDYFTEWENFRELLGGLMDDK